MDESDDGYDIGKRGKMSTRLLVKHKSSGNQIDLFSNPACNVSKCFNLTKPPVLLSSEWTTPLFYRVTMKIKWGQTCNPFSTMINRISFLGGFVFNITFFNCVHISLNSILFRITKPIDCKAMETKSLRKLLTKKKLESESWYINGIILHEEISFSL